jgi:hypothetical protein
VAKTGAAPVVLVNSFHEQTHCIFFHQLFWRLHTKKIAEGKSKLRLARENFQTQNFFFMSLPESLHDNQLNLLSGIEMIA